MRVVRVQWHPSMFRPKGYGGMWVPCFDPLSVLESWPDPTIEYRVTHRIPSLAETMQRFAGALSILATR